MSQAANAVLDPADPGSWGSSPFDVLFSLSKDEVEEAQLKALALRLEKLRPQIAALDHLATRQKVDRIEKFADAPPVLFDHRVYKSYPLGMVEQRKFDRMTTWLQRMTTHDLSSVSMDGVASVDSWLDRLGEHGLSVGHTTGTKGKLSFLPRSDAEWPTFSTAYYEMRRSMFGFDIREEKLNIFSPGYRRPHYWLGVRLNRRVAEAEFDSETTSYAPQDHPLTAALLSMAGRLQTAESRGELDKLEISPEILAEADELRKMSLSRDADLERWLRKLADDFRGQRVRIQGTTPDLVKAALRARELGIVCEPAPNSILMPGGGMKDYKDAPEDWNQLLMDVFGIDHTYASYGMVESLGYAPRCKKGFYHFYPYTLPILLDDDYVALPREGVQTGRMALFDFLAESYWGGFITGDQVTMHWDYACECGWTGPRIEGNISRFADLEGVEDDKISCAGTTEAYNAFMDYVAEI